MPRLPTSTAPYLFFSMGCIGLYGGYWQSYRRLEKIDYLEFMKNRINSAPVECPTSLTEKELEVRKLQRVWVEGIPNFATEIVVGSEPPPKSSNIHAIEYEWGGYVYTPITLKSGKTILINRGWIKEEDALECPEKIQYDNDGKPNKSYRFEGILAPFEYIPDCIEPFDVAKIFWPFINRYAANTRWSNINIPVDKVPVIVNVMEPTSDYDNDHVPVRFKMKDFMGVKVSPLQHFSYVIFWYSMCGISWFYAYSFIRNPRATRLFKTRLIKNRPVLKRSDVLAQPERNLKV